MNRYVTDTQALVRFLSGSKGIGKAADLIFSRADAGESTIIIPAVVLFEIVLLTNDPVILASSFVECVQ